MTVRASADEHAGGPSRGATTGGPSGASLSSSPALHGERAALTAAGQVQTAREAAAHARMLADALDTARLPDSHVQEDADCVDAERGFRP